MSTQFLVVSRAAFAESYSNRRAFWAKVALMVLNDIAWVIFYALLMSKAGNVRGWQFDDLAMLFATITSVFGIAIGVCGNCRFLGKLIADGEIDSVLTLPASPLSLLLFRKVEPVAIGDGLFGFLLFVFVSDINPERIVIYLVGTVLGAVVMTSFLVLISSMSFFLRGRHDHVDMLFNGMLIFGSYPIDLFGGVTKLFLFTVLPVAFISSVPARLVGDFNPTAFLALVVVATSFALVARLIFSIGLRNYRSGSLWSRA